MDQRIMLIALGVAALAFASLAFASGGQGWAAGNGMQGWNGTRMAPQGNESCAGRGMMQSFNETAHDEFKAAVESGDFAAAAELHGKYGFGGPMFEKLNATTFAKFSQVHKLQSGLMADLGIEEGQGRMAGEGMGRMRGMKEGRSMMEPEFAKGMRSGAKQNINQTTQQ